MCIYFAYVLSYMLSYIMYHWETVFYLFRCNTDLWFFFIWLLNAPYFKTLLSFRLVNFTIGHKSGVIAQHSLQRYFDAVVGFWVMCAAEATLEERAAAL